MPQVGYGAAAPTDTTQYWQAGDIVINNAPAGGQPYGWVCTVAGYPGTWVQMVQQPGILTSTLTSGTLPNGNAVILFNGSATSNQLPAATNHAPGFRMTIKNIANVNLTLTPGTAQAYVDATNITLTQNQVITLIANGTNWYKMA